MGLQAKIFIPLVILTLAISGYVYFIWLPSAVNTSLSQAKTQNSRTLKTLSDGLVPLLLAKNLFNVYDTIDVVLEDNKPDWQNIYLSNEKGQSLYPFEDIPLPEPSDSIVILRQPIEATGTLGELVLVYDFSHIRSEIEQQGMMLFLSILMAIIIFSVTLGIFIRYFVIIPARKLAKATNAMADGNYDEDLPSLEGGEIGTLVKSFKQMRETIQSSTKDLKEERDRGRLLESVVVNANDGVIITKANLDEPGPEILYVNEAFTKISGYEPEEVIGTNPRILQGEGTDASVLKELRHRIKSGKTFQGELKNYTKDGDPYWLDISIVPVKDDSGEVTHFTAIERNITERKNFEEELKESKRVAESANLAKSEFLANMSHELRTPMNGIIGLSDLLSDTRLDPEQIESVKAINNSAEGLLVLLNDLLDFSKIEAGEMTLETVPFDLKQTIDDTVSILKYQAEGKDVELSSNYTAMTPEWVMGDPARIRQILTNLIGNAIKFTEEGRVSLDVSVSKESGKEMLRFRVDDTGIGIPKDRQDDIFKKFTQADESTTRRFGGTGLGLAICKNLVELMHGKIGVESVEGRGSTFWFEIPLTAYEQSEEEKQVLAQATSYEDMEVEKEGLSVLVVDDHPVNLMFARKLLKKIGIDRVQLADNGAEAVEYVQTYTYNIILMDCQMPDMDGFQTTEAIREFQESVGARTPIIAVTANAMKGDREKCLDAGMDDYISKPIKVETLSKTISKWHIESKNREQIKLKDIDIAALSVPSEDEKPKEEKSTVEDIPVDQEHFSFIFDDCEPEEIKEMVDLFAEQADLSVAVLQEHALEGEQEEWKKAAHKLKGSAANLGANDLAAACKDAEEGLEASQADKKDMLQKIQAELNRLMTYLTNYSAP